MDNETPQYYVNKGGEWIPVPDDSIPVVSPEELSGNEVTPTEYLDEVLESMAEASSNYLDITLDHEDAGMVSDYIEELRARVAELETMVAGIPDKALPRLKLLAQTVHDFVEASPDHEPGLSDDALEAFGEMRLRLFRYEKARAQA